MLAPREFSLNKPGRVSLCVFSPGDTLQEAMFLAHGGLQADVSKQMSVTIVIVDKPW